MTCPNFGQCPVSSNLSFNGLTLGSVPASDITYPSSCNIDGLYEVVGKGRIHTQT